jgi:hypothetical protein
MCIILLAQIVFEKCDSILFTNYYIHVHTYICIHTYKCVCVCVCMKLRPKVIFYLQTQQCETMKFLTANGPSVDEKVFFFYK